jgi:tellurite resistance protein TehA-like permease
MKFGATLLLFATVVATVYGVLFSKIYPRVEIESGIVTLCALFGLVTCLAVAGLWKLLTGGKS